MHKWTALDSRWQSTRKKKKKKEEKLDEAKRASFSLRHTENTHDFASSTSEDRKSQKERKKQKQKYTEKKKQNSRENIHHTQTPI